LKSRRVANPGNGDKANGGLIIVDVCKDRFRPPPLGRRLVREHHMLKRGIAIAAAMSALAVFYQTAYADSCADLTGSYVCQTYCPAEGIGGHDTVVQNGYELQLSNGKTTVKGYLSAGSARAIISTWIWKENPLKGVPNADCTKIVWANGSIWIRIN
jgi:hypothetical protein